MTPRTSRRLLMGIGSGALLAGLATRSAEAQTPTALRILLLNPNSSPDFTRIIAAEARRVGSPGTEFVEVTAPFGPRYIGTRTTIAIAGHAAVDALAQTLASGQQFDAAILAGFGAQGVPALQEMARVLSSGGHLLVLDFSLPQGWLRRIYRPYLHRLLPRLAGLVTGEEGAYQYLGASIERFPSGQEMCALITQNHFDRATDEPLSGGIVTIYCAEKADPQGRASVPSG